jgi:flavodoxin
MLTRRALLRTALAATAGAALGPELSACTSDSRQPKRDTRPLTTGRTGMTSPAPATRVLLAYFSRAGENYRYGGRRNLTVGNTEVLARTIASRINCDVYRIEAADPYPAGYDATVARNVREQDTDARPAIAGGLPKIGPYDVVLLASPIWNVRAPLIMTTFTDGLDFTGKTVHPVVTYAVSGLGSTASNYTRTCTGATVGDGLAVLGETVADADRQVMNWLNRTRLT